MSRKKLRDKKAAEPLQEQIEDALADIDALEKAEAVVNKLADEVDDEPAVEATAEEQPPPAEASPAEQAKIAARRMEESVGTATSQVDEAAAAIKTAAEETTRLEGPAYDAVAEHVQAATAPELEGESEKLERPRRFLRDAILDHPGVSFIDKLDAELFILRNNHFPCTPVIDTFFYQLSLWFTSGWGWLAGVAMFWPTRREWTEAPIKRIAVPMWVAGIIVEWPVKAFFRRRRPFIDIVRTVVVGKKPGNWSFPSGHSATAFAGAWMLSRFLPRWQWLWYTIAGLVGFSRVYVGAHYPGDVVSGSIFGIVLAELTRRLMTGVWGKSKR